jgi:hypothetical protein
MGIEPTCKTGTIMKRKKWHILQSLKNVAEKEIDGKCSQNPAVS